MYKPTLPSHTHLQATQACAIPKLTNKYAYPNTRIENKALVVTAPTRNWRFSATYDSFVVAQTFVLRMNICGKNRQLLVAANRYASL